MRPIMIKVAFVMLSLLAAPALAGEWVQSDAPSPGWRTVEYRSEKLLPGEEVIMSVTPLKRELTQSGASAATSVGHNVLLTAFFDLGDHRITGFRGVNLHDTKSGEDKFSFYKTVLDKMEGSAAPRGDEDLVCRPNGSVSDNHHCFHICYERNEDAQDVLEGGVPCTSPQARWIAIVVRSRLAVNDGLSVYVFGENVKASDRLVFGIEWQGNDHIWIPVDDTFRDALWGGDVQ